MLSLWINTQRGIAALFTAVIITQGAQAAGLMTPADGTLPDLQIKQHHVTS